MKENYRIEKNGDVINIKTGKKVKPFTDKNGENHRVTLFKDGKKKHYLVKILLAEKYKSDSYHEEYRNQVRVIDKTKPLSADNVEWYNYTTHGR